MRPLSVPLLVLPLIGLSCAAPLITALGIAAKRDVHLTPSPSNSRISPAGFESFSDSLPPHDESLSSGLLDTTGEVNSIGHAVIIAPCQDCHLRGADVYHPLDLRLLSGSVHDCDITFALNGSLAKLTKSETTSRISIASGERTYSFRAELFCAGHHYDESTAEPSHVDVGLETDDRHDLADPIGFTFTSAPGSGIDITSVRYTSGVDRNIALKTPCNSSSPGNAVERVGLDRIVPSSNDTTFGSSNHNQTCIEKLHNKVVAAGQAICHKACEALKALLHTAESSLGEERFAYYRDRAQKAFASMKLSHDSDTVNATQDNGTIITDPSSGKSLKRPFSNIDITESQRPLIQALEILLAVLGAGGLFAFIRIRCCSLRRRVERLADREERVKAREYRCAARREAWRRRWAGVKRACTCCFGSCESEDADIEKQALVSEQDSDDESVNNLNMEQATANLSGLYYAREMVAEILRSRRHRQSTQHDRDPGAMYVAGAGAGYPYLDNASAARSRASSLPSYNSEVLPDYTSQPDAHEVQQSMRIVNGFRRRPRSPTLSVASSGATPDSSIPEISPRPSAETLRTDPSFPSVL